VVVESCARAAFVSDLQPALRSVAQIALFTMSQQDERLPPSPGAGIPPRLARFGGAWPTKATTRDLNFECAIMKRGRGSSCVPE
jgi:hypothetical protein